MPVLRLLHRQNHEVMVGGIRLIRSAGGNLSRQAAGANLDQIVAPPDREPDYGPLGIDQFGFIRQAHQGHGMPGHRQLRRQQRPVGCAEYHHAAVVSHFRSPLRDLRPLGSTCRPVFVQLRPQFKFGVRQGPVHSAQSGGATGLCRMNVPCLAPPKMAGIHPLPDSGPDLRRGSRTDRIKRLRELHRDGALEEGQATWPRRPLVMSLRYRVSGACAACKARNPATASGAAGQPRGKDRRSAAPPAVRQIPASALTGRRSASQRRSG